MRRADRLFQILMILRRRQLTTAAQLAEELEVSERTIYRDISDLMSTGVPIRGEAGLGYELREGFEVPPLMFSQEELLALHFGLRMVRQSVDNDLAKQAASALNKIDHVLPEELKNSAPKEALHSPMPLFSEVVRERLGALRRAVDNRNIVSLNYSDENSQETSRDVRPLALLFWGKSWTLSAWCEKRQDFRSFRLDRMQLCHILEENFNEEPGKDLKAYLAQYGQSPEDLR